ncbi:hypothetical protein K466DRAFT_607609 [Polyporus arcularius HHB13444]|uniref:Uncharacterized protein n=1 Tax=Polyporus arcularius HHB13444 TaxID=1314778 RepID=A0A5C3NNJ6_9APHY|nr:hypothetical protein K466DRAFT_607609 [Polyporus arcularius HHB13444]
MPHGYIPPPPPAEYTLLFARWTGWLETRQDDTRTSLRHAYTLAIRPDEPIVAGRMVKILAITTPRTTHAPNCTPRSSLDTCEPHLFGRVEDVWRVDEDTARARVRNLCTGNRVVEAEVDFPYALATATHPTSRALRKWSAVDLVEIGLDSPECVRPELLIGACDGPRCWLAISRRLNTSLHH